MTCPAHSRAQKPVRVKAVFMSLKCQFAANSIPKKGKKVSHNLSARTVGTPCFL